MKTKANRSVTTHAKEIVMISRWQRLVINILSDFELTLRITFSRGDLDVTEILVNHSDMPIQHNYRKLNLSIRREIRLKNIKSVSICNRIETRKS